MSQFIRFILVGIVNSGLGYAIIFACMYLAKLSPELSNVIGYMIGLFLSYLLHRGFTFGSKQNPRAEFVRFVFVFLVAYLANLATLIILVRVVDIHAGLSQVIAGAVYVGTSYLLNRIYVFRPSEYS